MSKVLVQATLTRPTSGGDVPANGYIEAKPSVRRDIDDPDAVILPARFTARLGAALTYTDNADVEQTAPATPGVAWFWIDPTDAGDYADLWYWTFTERTTGGTRRYCIVPTSVSTLDYDELQDVIPGTYDPDPSTPLPGWSAALAAETARAMAAEAAIEGSDVDSVAGLSGTVTAAGLKTALSLPSDTEAQLAVVVSAINAEILVRQTDDLALQADISAEAEARDTAIATQHTADVALFADGSATTTALAGKASTADLTTEATTRASADTANANAITAEATARAAAITAEATARLYRPDPAMTGPVATDSPTVTTGVAGDAAFNEAYAVSGGALPAIWPVDVFGLTAFSGNLWFTRLSSAGVATVSTYRFMCDGSEIVINTAGGANFWIDLYIDGRPYTSNPITAAITAAITPFGYQKLVFGTAKPRLIELRMVGGLAAVYTKKPYRIWKPAADTNPSVAVVGDSYVAPVVHDNTTGTGVTSGLYQQGMYQRMASLLGIRRVVTDGIAGTGYTTFAGGGQFSAAGRLSWLTSVNPDVIIVHDGGANDLNGGASVAQTITAATAYFTTLRTNHPNAKLVFVEGFAPPGFTPSTYNPNYISIRQGLQTALAAAGITGVYYLDIATTRPPISGSGYVTAPNGTGNSDVYIGTDQTHPTVAGHTYIRTVLAAKVARILADDGRLSGQLIA